MRPREADTTTRRFADAFDPLATWVNLLTASEPGAMNTREGAMPLALRSDRDAIEVALHSALARGRARVCRVRNTAELGLLWCSEPLCDEVRADPGFAVEADAAPLAYDAAGNLLATKEYLDLDGFGCDRFDPSVCPSPPPTRPAR